MDRILTLLAAAVLILTFRGNLQADGNIILLYTNSTNGRIDYCHCKSDPNGGVVKRASVYSRIRRENPGAFFFDTGDFLTFDRDDLLAKYMVRAYELLRYDAITPGDQEFTIGIESFYSLASSLPLVCGNLTFKNAGAAPGSLQRYRIIERDGVKAGVIGTIARDTFEFHDQVTRSRALVQDQAAEIAKDLAAIKSRGVDIVVLLSHSGLEKDISLAARFPELDVIIGGHSQNLLDPPRMVGKTLVVQAGMNGSHIGRLEIVRKGGRNVRYVNSFLVPDDRSPEDDPAIRSLIRQYQRESEKANSDLKFR